MAAALNEIPPPIPVPPPILGEPKFPMMETRMFNDTPMYITTIPKGTLLFRGMNKSADRKADFYGVKQPNGAYFLPKQYEIYFYPFPGIDQVVGNFDLVVIYVLTQDVKLATLITPSPHVRGDKNDIAALVSCDRIDFKPLNGRPDDPCFRPDFLNQNPDISGMIAIANDDREQFHSYERMVRSFEAENPGIELGFYSKYDDASKPSKYTKGGGIPELILYPLNGRPRNHVFECAL